MSTIAQTLTRTPKRKRSKSHGFGLHVSSAVKRRYVSPTPIQRHALVIKGFKTADFLEVIEPLTPARKADLLRALSISDKTLKRNADTVLSPEHSNTALMMVEAKVKAQEVFGSTELADEWLFASAMALDGARPIDLLNSTPGAQAVMDLLDRMEYGVYA